MNKEDQKEISILYVEDEPLLQKLAEKKLSRWVEKIYLGSDGLEGLEQYKAFRPDVVITDINMPNMDGLMMIRRIREIDPDAHVVILSAVSDTETLIEAIELGVGHYLLKPLNFDELYKILDAISHRLTIEKDLYDARQHYTALMDHFIVSKTDTTGHITFVNDNFCEISGYTPAELLGRPYNLTHHPDVRESVIAEIGKEINAKKSWKGVLEGRKKSGDVYFVDTTIIPILDQEGAIKEFMSIREDVTELESLRRKNREEEERLKEEEKQRRILEEVNKAKDSFLVLFTHELKTPLNAIINFSEYVNDKLLEPEIKDRQKLSTLLQSVKQNGLFMLEMVTNLLDVARLKAGKLKMNMEPFSVKSCILEVNHAFAPMLQSKKVTLTCECEEEVFIRADMVRFRQILHNLYSNAIKYANGEIRVSVEEGEKGEIRICIEDNGNGIVHKERVFELYEQDGKSIDREAKGSGVGLYLVKMLCDLMQIHITLSDSETLGGAKFILVKEAEKR